MLLEILIALIMGISIGTLTGLTPGIHINLVATFLLAISATLLLIFPPLALVIFISSMTITHIFIDFIPSIFLGAPDSDTVLAILPGHELLLKGQAYEAVILSVFGCLIGIFLFLPFIPVFIFLLPIIYPYIQNIIPIILILIIGFMLYFEKNKIIPAMLIIILAAFLGLVSSNLNLSDPLLPMLTGLFGSSSLITSITKKQTIPTQEIVNIKNILANIKKSSITKTISSALLAGPICSFLPTLGSSQASTIGSYIVGDLDEKEFLIVLGIINSLVMALSFVTLYSIDKMRTGSAAAVSQLITKLTISDLISIILAILLSGIIAFIISIQIAKLFSKTISKINYNKLSIFILAFLSLIVFIFSGFIGFLLFITSTALGIFCILTGVRRTCLMACLMIPTILFYLL